MSLFSRLFTPFNRTRRRGILFEMWIEVNVKDAQGKVTRRLKRPCRSYVRQIIDRLRIQMSQLNTDVKDIYGATTSLAASSENLRVNAAVNVDTWGIQVGTGTGAVTISDYALGTQIAHGTGSGQLQYGSVSVGSPTIVGSTAQFTIARTFTNNSGASITVNEVGLVEGPTGYRILLERSLLTFSVANGGSATVTYTIKVTV